MAGERKRRGGLLLFTLLVAVTGAAGTWNYRRNVAEEDAAFRPYRSYSQADLAALVGAYEQEIASLRDRYERSSGRRAQARDHQFMDERLDEFERVQRTGRTTRALGATLAESETTLKLLREEVERRSGAGKGGLDLFLRRLFVYRV